MFGYQRGVKGVPEHRNRQLGVLGTLVCWQLH